MSKTTQIVNLQNYLREEISNIQTIVDENNFLKKELDSFKTTLALKNQEHE
jgi:hypothetical protein